KTLNDIKKMEKIKKNNNYFAINLLSVPIIKEYGLIQNILLLFYKNLYPHSTYVFGGLHHDLPGNNKVNNFREQAENLIRLGVDGIKMIEGKPSIYKNIKYSLDSSIFDNFYDYLEKNKIPILFHVGDPPSFWEKGEIPKEALDRGWFYGKGNYPKREELYNQVENILLRFPDLKIIFAHFYFMSDNLKRAAKFLDNYDNVKFDLTPGTEMYFNFSKNINKWKQFFNQYQNKIVFGTDLLQDLSISEAEEKIGIMKKFLETDENFIAWGKNLSGLNLNDKVLEKIYYKNFINFVSNTPAKIDNNILIQKCKQLKIISKDLNEKRYQKQITNIIKKLSN
ncbi:MAG: amidohydrolase family protein, partial [Candidatus Woesearchaeota archaeon]